MTAFESLYSVALPDKRRTVVVALARVLRVSAVSAVRALSTARPLAGGPLEQPIPPTLPTSLYASTAHLTTAPIASRTPSPQLAAARPSRKAPPGWPTSLLLCFRSLPLPTHLSPAEARRALPHRTVTTHVAVP